jgi:hypothetical protein
MRNPNLINNSIKLLIRLLLVGFFVQQNISSDICLNYKEIKADIKVSPLSSCDRNEFMSFCTKKTISSSKITCIINKELNCKRTGLAQR